MALSPTALAARFVIPDNVTLLTFSVSGDSGAEELFVLPIPQIASLAPCSSWGERPVNAIDCTATTYSVNDAFWTEHWNDACPLHERASDGVVTQARVLTILALAEDIEVVGALETASSAHKPESHALVLVDSELQIWKWSGLPDSPSQASPLTAAVASYVSCVQAGWARYEEHQDRGFPAVIRNTVVLPAVEADPQAVPVRISFHAHDLRCPAGSSTFAAPGGGTGNIKRPPTRASSHGQVG